MALSQEDKQEIASMLQEQLAELIGIDKYTFQKDIKIFNSKNIQLGRTNGTKIGASDQKLGLWGATPVIQQSKINDPSGGITVDTNARAAINDILDVLEAIGITASS